MFNRLLPKKYDFFDLFDRHATTTLDGVKMVKEVIEQWPSSKEAIARIEEAEHQCDSITHMTVDLMRRTYITPFERDEIRQLITGMDDVMDHAQGAATKLALFQVDSIPEQMLKLVRVLFNAQEKIVCAVKELRKIKKADGIQGHCREINSLENEGDAVLRDGLALLFSDEKDPVRIMKLKEIYETLERAIDRCEDVANVIEGILIEHRG